MTDKGTIILCSNMYPPNFVGGAELIVHYHARGLKKLGWTVIVFTGDTQTQSRRHQIKHDVFDGIDVYRVFLTIHDYHFEFVNFCHPDIEKLFLKILKRYKPDVVHFHNIIGVSLGIIHIAKEYGAKTVLTFHDYWGICHKNTLKTEDGFICKSYNVCNACLPAIEDGSDRHIPIRLRQDFFSLMMRNVDAFISPSAYLAKIYITAGFPQERFHVVWNGIDIRRFQKVKKKQSSDILRLSFIGYFGKHKGIQTFLNALPLIVDRERIHVNLIGDGEEKKTYISTLKANGCLHLVQFWGKLANSEIDRVYRETDFLVLPSIWPENQPVSVTEAMAAGIPILASDIGGMSELVDDGVTGFLFEAGNTSQMAAIVERLLRDPAIASRMGRNARMRMSLHDLPCQIQKMLNIYQYPVSPIVKNTQNEHIVICMGRSFSTHAFSAFSSDVDPSCSVAYYFIHCEWCSDALWRSAWLCIVVDPEISRDTLNEAIQMKIPVVVPTDNAELCNHVQRCGNGLCYSNASEIWQILKLLHENDLIYDLLKKGSP